MQLLLTVGSSSHSRLFSSQSALQFFCSARDAKCLSIIGRRLEEAVEHVEVEGRVLLQRVMASVDTWDDTRACKGVGYKYKRVGYTYKGSQTRE